MIDHISLAVRDLAVAGRLYDAALAPLGYRRMIERRGTIGYGKKYPEFWLNERRAMADSGTHIALRAASAEEVQAFHAAALAAGAASDGAPGPRPEYTAGYYAAFVTDLDGNKVEAVTFLKSGEH